MLKVYCIIYEIDNITLLLVMAT